MIYELRMYPPVASQMPKLLARFRDTTIPIWAGLRAGLGDVWPTCFAIAESPCELASGQTKRAG
jgi:hypothetical protein